MLNKNEDTPEVKSKTTPTKGEGSFNFNRDRTPEETANYFGNKTKVVTATFLSVFSQLGGIMFLFGSLYLSYLEALNAAVLIQRPHQFELSLGLSVMAVMFSIIGFMFLMRYFNFKRLKVQFPALQEAKLKKEGGDKGKKLFEIGMTIIHKELNKSLLIAIVFLIGNVACTGFTVWAVVEALWTTNSATATSVWIYTFSISILALFAGACITMISPDEMGVKELLTMSIADYEQYDWCDKLSSNLDNVGNGNFQ